MKKAIIAVVSSVLMCGIAATAVSAATPRINNITTLNNQVRLRTRSATYENQTWNLSEANSYVKGISTGSNADTYKCILTVGSINSGYHTLPTNSTRTVYWSGLLRDRSMNWMTVNPSEGDCYLQPGRQYATY